MDITSDQLDDKEEVIRKKSGNYSPERNFITLGNLFESREEKNQNPSPLIWDKTTGKLPPKSKHENDFYTNLVTKGPFVPADSDSEIESVEDIPWFGPSLMKESVAFHEKYFGPELLSLMAALFFGFAVKPNSAVLLRTGHLLDPQVAFHRYLSTSRRIYNFFDFDWTSKKAYTDFRVVRKMHALASRKPFESHPTPEELKLDEPWKLEMVEAMHKDLEFLDATFSPSTIRRNQKLLTWNPPVPVSQFDMATTQLGLWGTTWLFPEVFGISDRTSEMKGVIHSWAVFGRLLGIKDEFNICLKNDPEVYDKMFKDIVLYSLRTMDTTVVTIQAAFMDAFSKHVPLVCYKATVYFGLRHWDGYEGRNLWKIMTWWDKICLKFMQFIFWIARNFTVGRILINCVGKLWLSFNIWLYLHSSKNSIK